MFENLIALCTSREALYWTVILSDLSIAAAYFAIPVTMAIVMRHRRHDIVYPWLWGLFVVFILACGLTHLVHVWSATVRAENLAALALADIACALASVATAVAFAYVLPEIKLLPSPAVQRQILEEAVAERTREKDLLIREIHHQLGNQIQVLQSLVSIETREAEGSETIAVLQRMRALLEKMADEHRARSADDYVRGDPFSRSGPRVVLNPR